jgi:hypothetical protein
MFWFNHPKPVGSGKAVATLVKRDSGSGHRFDMQAPVLDVPTLHAGVAALPDTLRFSVRYTLPEYTSFMWQHCGYLIRRRRIGRLSTWMLQTRHTALAALNFVLLGRARRTYDFTIDAHGIMRESGGVTLIKWDDVRAMRRYKRGTMLVLARGTLPIPRRSLDAGQQAALDAYGVQLRAARRAA